MLPFAAGSDLRKNLPLRVQEAGGIALDDARRGLRLLLGRYARSAVELPLAAGEADEAHLVGAHEAQAARLLDDLAAGDAVEGDYELRLTVACRSRAPSRLLPQLTSLLRCFADARRLRLTLYLPSVEYPWWEWALPLAERLRPFAERELEAEELRIGVFGSLGHCPDPDLADVIAHQDIRLEYLLADPLWEAGAAPFEEQLAQVEALAELGLRVPVAFFVHSGNLAQIPQWIPAALECSLQSGFALRPVTAHPGYGRTFTCPPPASEALLRLAADSYRRYPYYDEVLEPVASVLARLDPERGVKLPLELLVDEDGTVGQFYKLPSAAQAVHGPEPVAEAERQALRRRVWRRAVGLTAADRRCPPCQLRHLCRGMDRLPGDGADPRFELTCDSWQFFLEALIWERYYTHHPTAAEPRPGAVRAGP